MHNINIDLALHFESKWHCGSGEGGLMADRLVRRDARGWPYIPGSTLKGVIRESCEKLARTFGFPDPADPHQTALSHPGSFAPLSQVLSPVDEIFGNKYEGGRLFFKNSRLEKRAPLENCFQSRIQKYRKIGTAKEKHLFESEYTLPDSFNSQVEGSFRALRCYGEGAPPLAFCLLVAGIMNVNRLGGDKSTGGGNLKIEIPAVRYNNASISIEKLLDDLEFYIGFKNDLYPPTAALEGKENP